MKKKLGLLLAIVLIAGILTGILAACGSVLETPDPHTGPGESGSEPTVILDEDGIYSSKDDVALYIHLYGKLPSNFITKKEAQELGYAEADPTFDVEGIDAAHKLTLLASIAFGIPLQFDKVFTEGISKVTAQDVKYAEDLGFRIKHLGIARRAATGIELRVHPTLIPEEQLIANVNGVKNAVLVQANAVGPTLYYGAGAGAGPTASAVVADVVDIVRDISYTEDGSGTIPQLAFESLSDLTILPREEMTTGYYIRINAEDQTGVLADVTTILSRAGISIDAIMQQPRLKDLIPIVILTDPVKESKMDEALQQIQALPVIHGEIVRIRLESLDN